MLLTFTNWNSVRGISSWYQKFGSTTTLRCRCLKSTRFKALHIENCNVCKSSNTYHTRHKQVILSLARKKKQKAPPGKQCKKRIWNTKTLFTAMHGFKSKKKKKKTARIEKKKKKMKKKAPWLQMNKKKKKMAWIQKKKKASWI